MAGALGFFIHNCHPWQRLFGYEEGNIYIPQWVFSTRFWHNRGSLRDVIRHEYAHALVYHYPEFFGRRSDYRRVFGRTGSDEDFVSEYAQTEREEDLAETFMVWLRTVHYKGCNAHKARREMQSFSPALKRKFQFLERLGHGLEDPVVNCTSHTAEISAPQSWHS